MEEKYVIILSDLFPNDRIVYDKESKNHIYVSTIIYCYNSNNFCFKEKYDWLKINRPELLI